MLQMVKVEIQESQDGRQRPNSPAYTDIDAAAVNRARLERLRAEEAQQPTTKAEVRKMRNEKKLQAMAQQYNTVGDEVARRLRFSDRRHLLAQRDAYFQRDDVGEAIRQVLEEHFPQFQKPNDNPQK